jgi:putative transposase
MKTSTPQGNRHSIRLSGYDYTQPGAYFLTICTYQRVHLFGEIKEGRMFSNAVGEIAEEEWRRSAQLRRNLRLDEFILMPNHLHGVVWLIIPDNPVAANGVRPDCIRHPKERLVAPVSGSLGAFVAGFKAAVTRRVNQQRLAAATTPVWQRNYYEHIVRRAESLNAIRSYIRENPHHWERDTHHPAPNGPDPRAVAIWQMLREEEIM